ncbi:Ferric enterobactin-binding periplasmic protein FepB [Klebsiella pneumoniae]|nr:Ferric enterobactin-binding periplasmic protein FepB [Klebsiella pneumoniae]
MNFFSFCRRGALTGMLLLLGITSAQAADWPRQVTDSYGTHTLPSQPLRIVSTSVTLTGSLLAIDAPVVASGATTPNNRVADSQGFLRQWSEVAKARKLARLYIGEPSAEAVAAQMPDLILVSATAATPPCRCTISLKPSPRRWSSTMTIKAGKPCSPSWGRSPVMNNRPARALPTSINSSFR